MLGWTLAHIESMLIQIKSLALGNQERMDFLREDLTHLFDDRGIDQSQYDDVVRVDDLIKTCLNFVLLPAHL